MGFFKSLFVKKDIVPEQGANDVLEPVVELNTPAQDAVTPKRPGTLAEAIVLFVDDDPDLRLYVKEELEEFASDVSVAKDGVRALEILRSTEIDLVISDVMMPEMDGLTLCHSIKTDSALKDIPVILLSARSDPKTMTNGIMLGADIFIPKPFNIDDLILKMSGMFEGGQGKKSE